MGQLALDTEYISAAAYLKMERASDRKHEYFQGQIFEMSGAQLPHNRITRNVISALDQRLGDGPCEILPSDQRVHIPILELFTYPDAVVVCGPPQMLPDTYLDTLLNPTLIVEVLSPSTRGYDRRDKFAFYRATASLRQYLMLDSERLLAELYTRDPDRPGHWDFQEITDPAADVPLDSIGCRVPLAALYRGVEV